MISCFGPVSFIFIFSVPVPVLDPEPDSAPSLDLNPDVIMGAADAAIADTSTPPALHVSTNA